MGIRSIFALSFMLAIAGCVRTDLAPGVNPDAIRAIQLGMTMDEVIGKLGMPLSIGVRLGTHDGRCRGPWKPLDHDVSNEAQIRAFLDSAFNTRPCCETMRREQQERRFNLTYSRLVGHHGPMLWVHFNGLGRVTEVFAKLYSHTFPDEHGLYLLNTRGPNRYPEGLLEEYFSQ